MKKLITKLCLLGAMVLASVQLSNAVSISSQIINPEIGFVGSPFLIQPFESVSYIISSTGTTSAGVFKTTIAFQYSSNNQNWVTELTSAPYSGVGLWECRGELPIKYQKTYYRFKVLGSSGCSPVVTLYDNDNEVMTIKNRKNVDTLILNDESLELKGSMKANKYNYVIDTTTNVVYITTPTTQLLWGRESPVNKKTTAYTPGTFADIKNSYSILSATYGAVSFQQTLSARPIISTETANNGDVAMFEVSGGTMVFTSGTNTGLILSAETRAVGNNGIIGFIFRNGIWREIFYSNNQQ